MNLDILEKAHSSQVTISSSPLYSQPSLRKGIARTFSIFGFLDRFNYSRSENEADIKALNRDWLMVGKDLLVSIKTYEDLISSKNCYSE